MLWGAQGSVLGMFFNIFINELDEGWIKSADYTKLGEVTNTLEDRRILLDLSTGP